MKNIFAAFLILGFCTASVGKEASPSSLDNGIQHGLGAGGSVFYTWGFIYRHHFDNGLGFSGSLGGWFNQYQGHLGNSLGLLYTLAHHKFTFNALPNASIRVYLAAYLANIYRQNDYKLSDDHSSMDRSLSTGLGAGPGVEFFFNSNFSLHTELPWMTFITMKRGGWAFRDSSPNFGAGVIYYF